MFYSSAKRHEYWPSTRFARFHQPLLSTFCAAIQHTSTHRRQRPVVPLQSLSCCPCSCAPVPLQLQLQLPQSFCPIAIAIAIDRSPSPLPHCYCYCSCPSSPVPQCPSAIAVAPVAPLPLPRCNRLIYHRPPLPRFDAPLPHCHCYCSFPSAPVPLQLID
jgi:hypothetical protein